MQKRTEELKLRVSAEDKERILAKMDEAGVTNLSAYVRKMALDGICVRLELPELHQIHTLLLRCSNNLNQYAKHAHESGSVYAEDIRYVQKRLDEIWELERQVLLKLSAIQ